MALLRDTLSSCSARGILATSDPHSSTKDVDESLCRGRDVSTARSDLECARFPAQKLGWRKWASGRVELWASSSSSCTKVEVRRGILLLDPSEGYVRVKENKRES